MLLLSNNHKIKILVPFFTRNLYTNATHCSKNLGKTYQVYSFKENIKHRHHSQPREKCVPGSRQELLRPWRESQLLDSIGKVTERRCLVFINSMGIKPRTLQGVCHD